MKVVKYSGEVVEFNKEKLRHSLLKSGADVAVVDDVLQQIKSQIYDGIATKKIYKLAFSLLKKTNNSHAARYNLRTAIQQLGPAGFYFEKYIARLFEAEGFEAQTNLQLQGKCVSHEIDVVIKKANTIEMVECKFHAHNDAISDVKVPMYILSRFNDLNKQSHTIFSDDDAILGCRIVTNNRFSTDAEKFATCSGIQLLSWNYPEKQCLRKKIDQNGLYPITCLTTLTLLEKEKLLTTNVLLVKDVLENMDSLNPIKLSLLRKQNVLKESKELCKTNRYEN